MSYFGTKNPKHLAQCIKVEIDGLKAEESTFTKQTPQRVQDYVSGQLAAYSRVLMSLGK